MSPQDYVNVVVLPTVAEFLKARDDRRLAFLSCIATYHLCDYVAFAAGQDTKYVQNRLDGFCGGSLQVVRGLANGTKHPRPRKDPGPERVVVAAAFSFGTPGAGWGEGAWDGPALWVDVDGNTVFVHHAVQAVLLSLRTLFPAALDGVDLSGLEPFMLDWHKSAVEPVART